MMVIVCLGLRMMYLYPVSLALKLLLISSFDRTIEEGLVVVAAFSVELGIYFYPATPFDSLVASRVVYNINGFNTSKKIGGDTQHVVYPPVSIIVRFEYVNTTSPLTGL